MSDVIAQVQVSTEDDVLEAIKAANVLGFGIVVSNCWHPDLDEDGAEQQWWHVTVLSDAPHENPDETEEVAG